MDARIKVCILCHLFIHNNNELHIGVVASAAFTKIYLNIDIQLGNEIDAIQWRCFKCLCGGA